MYLSEQLKLSNAVPASSPSKNTGPDPARTMGGTDLTHAQTSVAGELTHQIQRVPQSDIEILNGQSSSNVGRPRGVKATKRLHKYKAQVQQLVSEIKKWEG